MEKYVLGFSVRSFPRLQNKQVDVLAKAAVENNPLPPDVFFETLKNGSVNCTEEPAKFVNAILSEDWRLTIMAYLRGHFVPEDEKEEKKNVPSHTKLLNRQRHTVSSGCLRTFVEVHLASRMQTTAIRNTHRHVLFAHRNEGSGGKSLSRRVLLAFDSGSCP